MAETSPLLSRGLGLVLVEFEYKYKGRDGVLVSIKPNERYVLLAKSNDHWWQVQKDHRSKPFYIPAKYVKELPTNFPSLLDFTDPPCPELVLHPMVVPVPVPVPVPKPLEDTSRPRIKQSDEVLIHLRPDASNRRNKNENRMSTFGVPIDLLETTHVGSKLLSSVGSSEARTTAPSQTTNMADSRKQPHLSGLEDQRDSGKSQVPSFSLSDPRSMTQSQNLLIPIEMPVVPPDNMPPLSEGHHEDQQQKEKPPREVASQKEEEPRREEDSHHIYESIQDLNLEALHRKPEGPVAPPQPVPLVQPAEAPATTQLLSDDLKPPLPKEDNLVDGPSDEDTVFTMHLQQQEGLIPRIQLDQKDPTVLQKQQEQRLMGNGVSEEGEVSQVRNLRHSIAEEMFTPGHRRISSDLTEGSRRHTPNSPQSHLLEKAGIINKTKVMDNGKKIRKNWSQSWTVLHGGILTFYRDPKSTPAGNTTKSSQIVPEYTVELRGASVHWATKDKSSKRHVLELKTRQGCEYLMQYDTENIIWDWFKVIQDTIQHVGPQQQQQQQPDQENLSEDEDTGSDREDKDRKRQSNRSSSRSDPEQNQIRRKLKRFLQRRPTLQSVKEKGYIQDNVFGCHLDTLCHRENTTIPKFVEKCIRAVERRGLEVDGIYRVSGNLAVIQKLRHKADHEEHLDLEDGQWEEIHVITGALKLFFRELPEPLFPFSCFDKFIAAIQLQDQNLRVSYLADLVRSLPLPNYDTMELLFRHLRRVIQHQDSNRMSVQSVAIVFGPTLLRPQTESNLTVHLVFQSRIVELLLNQYNIIFSEDQNQDQNL